MRFSLVLIFCLCLWGKASDDAYFSGEALFQQVSDHKLFIVVDASDHLDGFADHIFTINLGDTAWQGPQTEYFYKCLIIEKERSLEVKLTDVETSFVFQIGKGGAGVADAGNRIAVAGFGHSSFYPGGAEDFLRVSNYTTLFFSEDYCQGLTCGEGGVKCSVTCDSLRKCSKKCEAHLTACCKCFIVTLNGIDTLAPCCDCVVPRES